MHPPADKRHERIQFTESEYLNLKNQVIMSNKRNYHGLWIPREIWEHNGLSAVEKVLFADINSIIDNGLEFFKSNDRIAADLQCSTSTAKRAVSKLRKMSLIESFARGRKRIIVLTQKGKKACQKGQNGDNAGQNNPNSGPTRPYSSSGNSSFISSLEELNLDIGDFYPFRVNPNVHDLMREWVDHRIEMGKPLTERQIEKSFENLFLVSKGDLNDAQLCVEQALIGGWSKFYPPRHTDDWYG